LLLWWLFLSCFRLFSFFFRGFLSFFRFWSGFIINFFRFRGFFIFLGSGFLGSGGAFSFFLGSGRVFSFFLGSVTFSAVVLVSTFLGGSVAFLGGSVGFSLFLDEASVVFSFAVSDFLRG